MINIDSNAKEIMNNVSKRKKIIIEEDSKGLNESAETAVYMMKGNHFSNIDTGKLNSSIREETTGEHERTVGPRLNEKYPWYLEKGTEPHVIKGNPYLSWPGADHPVREVKHPGTKAYPYVEPTRVAMKTEFPQIMKNHYKKGLE